MPSLPTPPGQMVDIGEFKLHAIVKGQGVPAVILEPALSGMALQYHLIQAGVAEFTRVLAYDRAGQGWSDTNLEPRTPDRMAGELHALLDKIGLQPPYVMVGHSFGGLLARVFAGFHMEDVAGMVLVDSTHPAEYDPFPDIGRMVKQMGVGVRLMKIASRLGLGKHLTRMSFGSAIKSFPKTDLDLFLTAASTPKHHETALAEFSEYRCYYGATSEVPHTLDDIPLVVVTARKSISGRGKVGKLTADQMNELHQTLQKDLVTLSTRGEQILIPDATHFSVLFDPNHAAVVVDAIRKVIDQARQ